MARKQEEPYKICECGRGKVFTSERGKKRNAIVMGKQVCVECKMEHLYESLGVKRN